MIPDPADAGLCAELPRIRRAREYRLYDEGGRRYLDLWQLGGHAILGHRAAGVSSVLKAAIDRGLGPDLPSVRSTRLDRALRSLLPAHPHVRVWGGLSTCLAALEAWRGGVLRVGDLGDPATGEPASGSPTVGLWRPFAGSGGVEPVWDAVVPVLPFAMAGGPWAVCFRVDPGVEVPAGPPVSGAVLEAAATAVWALGRHEPGDLAVSVAAVPSPAWSVTGVYLVPRFRRTAYAEVFRAMLSAGVILSPWVDCPSILPAAVSPGERAKLLGLLRGLALE